VRAPSRRFRRPPVKRRQPRDSLEGRLSERPGSRPAAHRGAGTSPRRYSDAVTDDRGRRELTILNAIAEALNSAPDVQQAIDRTLAAVADLLGLRTGWIWLIDRETGQFYNAASLNLPPYLQEPVRMTGRSCWCIDAYRDGALTPKNIDVIECSRLRPAVRAHADDKTLGLAAHASIPLYFQGKPLGILNVTGPSWRKLTHDELRLLSTIAYQVGIAIERARLADDRLRLARAEERARIARDIHDTLAQGLTAIALHIEGAIAQMEAGPDKARLRLADALAVTRDSLEAARRSVHGLRESPLDGRPLSDALRALARGFTSDSGIPVRVRATDAALPSHLERELYHIAQEALTNVQRHARARHVVITLDVAAPRQTKIGSSRRRARLAIADDGRGFDTRARQRNRHGLLGMSERAGLVGGAFRITSRPGRGTTVRVSIPLESSR
jgi:two-component system, NarL family, sensor kinase